LRWRLNLSRQKVLLTEICGIHCQTLLWLFPLSTVSRNVWMTYGRYGQLIKLSFICPVHHRQVQVVLSISQGNASRYFRLSGQFLRSFVKYLFRDTLLNFYWNMFILDRHRAKEKSTFFRDGVCAKFLDNLFCVAFHYHNNAIVQFVLAQPLLFNMYSWEMYEFIPSALL